MCTTGLNISIGVCEGLGLDSEVCMCVGGGGGLATLGKGCQVLQIT